MTEEQLREETEERAFFERLWEEQRWEEAMDERRRDEALLCGVQAHADLLLERDTLKAVLKDLLEERGAEHLGELLNDLGKLALTTEKLVESARGLSVEATLAAGRLSLDHVVPEARVTVLAGLVGEARHLLQSPHIQRLLTIRRATEGGGSPRGPELNEGVP